jgi:hypothetical protein
MVLCQSWRMHCSNFCTRGCRFCAPLISLGHMLACTGPGKWCFDAHLIGSVRNWAMMRRTRSRRLAARRSPSRTRTAEQIQILALCPWLGTPAASFFGNAAFYSQKALRLRGARSRCR